MKKPLKTVLILVAIGAVCFVGYWALKILTAVALVGT